MAVICCVMPTEMVGLVGVNAIESNVGGVTVSVAEPLTVPEEAEIVVEP